MKLKTLTLATLTALYAGGVAASMSDLKPTAGAAVLKPTALQAPEGYNPADATTLSEEDKQAQRVRATFGPNRQITNASKRVKFLHEEGISGEHTYIVQLHEKPVTTYTGGVQGLQATALRANKTNSNKLFNKGQALNSAIPAYQEFLIERHNEVSVLANAQGIELNIRKHYTNAINGVSVQMTPEDAERLSTLAQVKFVSRSQTYQLQTYNAPEMIGAGEVWDGTATGVEYKGEGVVVGVIDTGINTDHIAFADIGGDGYDHTNPWGEGQYIGDCSIEEFENLCNDKLIGIRSYPIVTSKLPSGFDKNGEDYQGHGSHTAGTAAGNVLFDQEFVMPSSEYPDGMPTGHTIPRTSGVAPHANIIAYQACDVDACPGESLLASIDDAIEDGVDVLNYSISGSDNNPWTVPVELAFLRAHEAGIVVSASAGNSGRNGPSSAMHPSPWLMTVGAATHDKAIDLSRDLDIIPTTAHWSAPKGTITGKGITEPFTGNLTSGPRALGLDYNTENYGRSDAWIKAKYCQEEFAPGTFDADDIVLCGRSPIVGGDGIARVQRAENVAAGGAGGFVLFNYHRDDNLVNDAYSLPGIHISRTDGYNLERYVSREANQADGDIVTTIGAHSMDIVDNEGDVIADFSGRGPSRSVPEHLIPSITGPGVDVYAPYADESTVSGSYTSDWAFLSGTSMSAPHLTGVAALIRQANPDWTVAEIISAIMMTSENTITEKYGYNNTASRDVDTYVAGSGRVNVERAIRAGLVLDETPENFHNANPDNGGTVRNLNMAELVNLGCSFQGCTWVRQFRATQDGTWNFSAETGEYGVQLTSSPASFTLKAGETQLVQINARLMDTQGLNGGSDGIEVHGRAYFKATDASIPDSVLPVALAMSEADLPANINVIASRNDGRTVVKGLQARAQNEFTPRVFEPVVATKYQVTLPQTTNGQYLFTSQNPYDFEGNLHSGLDLQWVNVAADSKRLMAEVVSMDDTTVPESRFWQAFAPFIHVGIDANENGVIDYADELVCVSNNEIGNRRALEAQTIDNWCNVNSPDAGNYWVIVENAGYNADYVSTFTAAYGVVSDQLADNVTVSGPASVASNEPFEIDIAYDIDMIEGDRVYTTIDLGTEGINAGNIGMMAVNILRGKDEVSLVADRDTAKVGDIVTLSLDVAANITGFDRDYMLEGMLPEGLKYVEDSIQANGQFLPETMSVDGTTIRVSGMQEDSTNWQPRYEMSTNVNSDMCHMPHDIKPDGGYIDMLTYYGMLPYMGGDYKYAKIAYGGDIGDVYDPYGYGIQIPFSWLYGPGAYAQMYNNAKYDPYKAMYIFPEGFIEFSNLGDAYYTSQDRFNPDLNEPLSIQQGARALVSPLWKGAGIEGFSIVEASYTPLQTDVESADEVSGITLGNYGDGRVLIEWDNMRSAEYAGRESTRTPFHKDTTRGFYKNLWSDDYADNYDMQVLLEVGEYRMNKGEFEFIFAFDNLDQGMAQDLTTSGVFGYKGPSSSVGPLDTYHASQHTYNNAAETLSDELVVCYDYVGPESSAFNVTFDVEVTGAAIGLTHDLQFMSKVAGLDDSSIASVLSVNSTLNVYDIADQSVTEEQTLSGIEVVYLDSEGDANTITVTGDNITAEVTGNMISITPDVDFSGETIVTVTVADAVYENDNASTSFTLTVTPLNDAPMAATTATELTINEGDVLTLDGSVSVDADGDELSYNWTGSGDFSAANSAITEVSGLSTGSYEFTLTVSDGVESSNTTVMVTVNKANGKSDNKKSKGGSFGWLFLTAIPLLMARRKKLH